MSRGNVEDIFPLTALQQGMLFHTVCAPNSGVYVTQSCWVLRGNLDASFLRQAWHQVIQRHSALRAAFVWENLRQPLQIIMQLDTLHWEEKDFGGLTESEQKREIVDFLERDRENGFELSQPPLMRLFLISASIDCHYFIWSYHHLLMDGWSASVILTEVFDLYEALKDGRDLKIPHPRPFKDYVSWLKQRDRAGAEEYWRRTLEDFNAATSLPGDMLPGSLPGQEGKHEKQEITLPARTTAAIQSLVRQKQVTLNSLVQGLWGLLLSHYSGSDDVVFGAIFSGRPPELSGSESIVGVFINTLPVRIRVVSQQDLWVWIKDIHSQLMRTRQFEHTPLIQIREWSAVRRGEPLFESLLVFDNYPVTRRLGNGKSTNSSLEVSGILGSDQNSYPITLTTGPASEMVFEINHDSKRFRSTTIDQVLSHLQLVLEEIARSPEATVNDIDGKIAEAERMQQVMEEKRIEQSNFGKFMKIKPKKVISVQDQLVKARLMQPGQNLPLVVEPNTDDIDVTEWAGANKDSIERDLTKHGGILFRGFAVESANDFEKFAKAICPRLLNANGEHNRESVSGNIYTPVSYPSDKRLLWHNENSFNDQWPKRVFFCCLKPAQRGGETPIVDSRLVYELIDEQIKETFMRKQVMYVRNYGEGLGLGWETIFQTSIKAEAEEQCRRTKYQFKWKDRNRLNTSCVRPAVVRHPDTDERVWFNQAQHWHLGCLEPEVRKALLMSFEYEDLPRSCFYGDGSSIDDSVMQSILDVYARLEVTFAWQPGDILMLDNLLTAHGRNAYEGDRRLLVAMGEMLSYDDVLHN